MLSLSMAGAIVLPALDPEIFRIGPVAVRWYGLAYILGIVLGWRLLLRMAALPGAPMARRHVDDFVLWATLGVVLGGRIGHILFYNFHEYSQNITEMFKIWQGGMSFHGGVIGVSLAILIFTRLNKIDWLRFHDYVATVVPIGSFFGRLANFWNGELYGKPTDVPWAMVFWTDETAQARHPSQLYQAGLEGLLLLAVMLWLFFRTDARKRPGMLVGSFILGYGLCRVVAELWRQPDANLTALAETTGLSMGQWLSVPMILGGIFLIWRARNRPMVV
jgi:phosphatidylglycerol---prolipoprotein diacylglyceryl transferase